MDNFINIFTKTCAKCGGDMYLGYDPDCEVGICFQCGKRAYLNVMAALPKSSSGRESVERDEVVDPNDLYRKLDSWDVKYAPDDLEYGRVAA